MGDCENPHKKTGADGSPGPTAGIVGALFGPLLASPDARLRITATGVLAGPGGYYLSFTIPRWNINPPITTLYTHGGPVMAGQSNAR